MDDAVRGPIKVPAPLVWLTLWVSIFLEFGCFYSIPVLSVHRLVRYHTLTAPSSDLKTPLLLVALFASVLTWQAWYDLKNGDRRSKPAKLVDAETRRKNGRLIGMILGGLLLLLECMWLFAFPGRHVDWSLVAVLNAGCGVGVVCFLWANRQITVMKEATARAMPAAASPFATAGSSDASRYATNRTLISEAMISWLTFLCCFTIITLAFTPAVSTLLGRSSDWPLGAFFGGMGILTALGAAVSFRKSRRDDQTRYALNRDGTMLQETPKGAAGYYVSFLAIGVMLSLTSLSHLEWPRFVLCNAGEFAAYLLLRWTLSRPPMAGRVNTPPVVNWLPEQGLVRATPNEIVLAAPWGMRAFVGIFGLLMAAMTVTCLLLAFAPGLFDSHPRHSHGGFMVIMPLCLFVGMALFTTIIIGGAGPRDLRLELDSRRYAQKNWKPLPGWPSTDNACIPFRVVHTVGSMDEDMAGVCVREYRYKGNTSYLLQIAWRDQTRSAYILRRFTTPEEGQIALARAAEALKLPALTDCR